MKVCPWPDRTCRPLAFRKGDRAQNRTVLRKSPAFWNAKRIKVLIKLFQKFAGDWGQRPQGLNRRSRKESQGRCHTRPEACKQGPGRFPPSFSETTQLLGNHPASRKSPGFSETTRLLGNRPTSRKPHGLSETAQLLGNRPTSRKPHGFSEIAQLLGNRPTSRKSPSFSEIARLSKKNSANRPHLGLGAARRAACGATLFFRKAALCFF